MIMDWNPLASFGGSLAGSVAGAIGQRRTNKMTAKENQKNRDFAWQQQQESQRFQYSMWKQANEYNEKYNSPAAQMARYQEAGLNPYTVLQGHNAIASAGTPWAGTPGAPGSAPYSNPMANVATDLSTGMDAIARFLQQDGIIAQNDKTRAEADAARVSADNAKTDMQLTLALKSLQVGLIKEETFGKILQNIFLFSTSYH